MRTGSPGLAASWVNRRASPSFPVYITLWGKVSFSSRASSCAVVPLFPAAGLMMNRWRMAGTSSLYRYINRSHFSIPLYSLRFLPAFLPKVRSNSVWEDSK